MRGSSFFRNLLFYLAPYTILILIIGVASINISRGYMTEYSNRISVSTLTQTRENVETILNEMDSLIINFSVSPEIITHIKSFERGEISSSEMLITKNLMQYFLSTPANAKPYIYSIYVYSHIPDALFVLSSEGLVRFQNFYDKDKCMKYLEMTAQNDIITERRKLEKYSYSNTPEEVITICRRVGKNEIIVLNIKAHYIEEILKNLSSSSDQQFLVFSEQKQVLLTSGIPQPDSEHGSSLLDVKESDWKIRINNQNYIYTRFFSTKYKWNYISLVPETTIYEVPLRIISVMVFLLGCCLVFGFLISYSITNKNYAYIKGIQKIMEAAEKGTTISNTLDKSKGEYKQIVQNIIKTFIEQSYLKTQLSERTYKMRTLELLALQSQINPHFLFNTLKSIYWKSVSVEGCPGELSQMIENVTDILYYSMDNPDRMVTFQQEIHNACNYVEIQKIRYKDKFQVILEYDNNIMNCQTIKLFIQPLIENSIYHGVKGKNGKGLIKVKVLLKNAFVTISVIDNGLGMTKNRLAEIRKQLLIDGGYGSSHIGLINTYKRLALVFGSNFSFKVLSKQNFGTAIIIRTPEQRVKQEPLDSLMAQGSLPSPSG